MRICSAAIRNHYFKTYNMETIKRFENYPIGIVIQSNFVSLGIYTLGFLVVLRVGLIFAILFLLFILSLEYRLLRYHCPNCFYWGQSLRIWKGETQFIDF